MHAALPHFSKELAQIMRLRYEREPLPGLDKLEGMIVAEGLAAILEFGFRFILRNCHLDKKQSEKAEAFFNENFVFIDPQNGGRPYYYQGKVLFRTARRGDDMNVLLKFCPRPDAIYRDAPFGRTLNPLAIVSADKLSESEADKLERDPDKVDIVIRFKDVPSMIELIGHADIDVVNLLLENRLQLSGNFGHIFKLGAIAQNVDRALKEWAD